MYAYVRNNPVNSVDPTGKFFSAVEGLFFLTFKLATVKPTLDAMKQDFAALARALQHKDALQEAAKKHNISWTLLASIGIRESGFRNIGEQATSRSSGGQGVFQIDIDAHPGTQTIAYDITKAADYSAGILSANMARYGSSKYGGPSPLSELRGIRAYNAGYGYRDKQGRYREVTGRRFDTRNLDRGTAHGNYVSTVFNLSNAIAQLEN
jgi:hypothetical protein